MLLLEKIKKDSIEARKAKESIKANLLTTLYAEAQKVGKDKGNRETTDEETIVVIKKFLKNNKETIDSFTKLFGLDINAYHQQTKEKEILESYLPKQLSKEELETIIKGLNTKDVGLIMRHLKDTFAGFYDGKLASEIAKGL